MALAEDADVHLTTNIVDCDPDDVHVGQEVSARFIEEEDVFLPVFAPAQGTAGGTDETDRVTPPDRSSIQAMIRPPVSEKRFEHDAVLSGVGRSDIGRRLMRDPLSLTVDAALAAIADAGLTPEDIDGLSTYPGGMTGMGMSEGGVTAVEEALRLKPTWINGGMELPGPGGSVIAAMLAVSAGLCRHVLCFRTVWEATHAKLGLHGGGGGRVGSWQQWSLPYGAMSAANWIGVNANQYFHRYGAARELPQ